MTTKNVTADPEKAPLRLWLRLLDCAGLIEREVRSRLREEYRITLPQFDLMAALDREKGDDGLPMGKLSEKLRVSNGNVTGVVNRLVRDGMIRRWIPANDRRTVLIALTEEGRNSFAAMARVHRGWINDMLADMAPAEREQLNSMLESLSRSVNSEGRRRKAVRRESAGTRGTST